MAHEPLAIDSAYRDVALQASYQIEALARVLREAAVTQHAELDVLTISLALRIKQLNSTIMSVLSNNGTPKNFLDVMGEDFVGDDQSAPAVTA